MQINANQAVLRCQDHQEDGVKARNPPPLNSPRQIALAKQSESHALQARRSLRCDARPALSAAAHRDCRQSLPILVRSPPWLALQTDRPTSLPTFSIPHCADFSIIISSSQTAARYCFGLGCMVGYRHLCQPRWVWLFESFVCPPPPPAPNVHFRARSPTARGTCLMPVRAHWPDWDGTRRPWTQTLPTYRGVALSLGLGSKNRRASKGT